MELLGYEDQACSGMVACSGIASMKIKPGVRNRIGLLTGQFAEEPYSFSVDSKRFDFY